MTNYHFEEEERLAKEFNFRSEFEKPDRSDEIKQGIALKEKREKSYINHGIKSDSFKSSVRLPEINKDQKYLNLLKEGFQRVSPLLYMNHEQKTYLLEKIKILKFPAKEVLYTGVSKYDRFSCYILLEGEIEFFNEKFDEFLDLMSDIHFFGYDGPVFQKRVLSVQVEGNTVLGEIDKETFLELIHPLSQFATFLSRSIRYKDKLLDPLSSFKSLVLDSLQGTMKMDFVLKNYKKINSCLHSGANSNEIDYSAWFYSLARLPQNIFDTYFILLINHLPKAISATEKISENLIRKIDCSLRNRDSFTCLDGKLIVVMREMETDVLDFVCNLCIHIIESSKIRKFVLSPVTVEKLVRAKGKFDDALKIYQEVLPKPLKNEEIHMLRKNFGDNLADRLVNLSIQHQDYSVLINGTTPIDKDPVEQWIQNLWKASKNILGVNSRLEEIDDLVVDIIQGSKKSIINCISPHIYKEKDLIIKWAKDNNIKTQTQEFLTETDYLLALAHHYYEAFPEKNKEKLELERKNGIVLIDKTFSTGVKIILINTNLIDKTYKDPSIDITPVSKNHLIIHIGYTFGAQSYQIIKPLIMLFSSHARSLNIIGKSGGLTGNRKDILVANKIFFDKNHDFANVDYGEFDKIKMENQAKTKIHIGPMLTVAGTIAQNSDLLNFYKHVIGCIGLEMEGFYYAKEVENCKKHGLLEESFITRFFYYVSDLPLNSGQNLANEDGIVNWDEGVGSVNAITRFILQQIFRK